jgi:hypothetical protein
MTVFTADLEAKRMELLHELVAKGSIGVPARTAPWGLGLEADAADIACQTRPGFSS